MTQSQSIGSDSEEEENGDDKFDDDEFTFLPSQQPEQKSSSYLTQHTFNSLSTQYSQSQQIQPLSQSQYEFDEDTCNGSSLLTSSSSYTQSTSNYSQSTSSNYSQSASSNYSQSSSNYSHSSTDYQSQYGQSSFIDSSELVYDEYDEIWAGKQDLDYLYHNEKEEENEDALSYIPASIMDSEATMSESAAKQWNELEEHMKHNNNSNNYSQNNQQEIKEIEETDDDDADENTRTNIMDIEKSDDDENESENDSNGSNMDSDMDTVIMKSEELEDEHKKVSEEREISTPQTVSDDDSDDEPQIITATNSNPNPNPNPNPNTQSRPRPLWNASSQISDAPPGYGLRRIRRGMCTFCLYVFRITLISHLCTCLYSS